MNRAVASRGRLAVLIVLALFFGVGSAHAVPIQWVGNGHFYDVIASEGIAWNDAVAGANALGPGWSLASITSQAEHDFIASLLPLAPPDRSHYWLGGTDSATEGDWVWIDGEIWIDGVSFENWYGGEPNNLSDEDFLGMDFRSGWNGWNDASDSTARGLVRGFIAERRVPEPGVLVLMTLGVAGVGIVRRSRRP